jgi:galactonate dehydratase
MKIDRLRSFMSRDGDRPRVLVAIDTDDGVTGWGECYNHGPDRALAPILDYLATWLAGEDPTRVEFLIRRLLQQSRFPPGSLVLAVVSAVDHALWEISAKALGVPVYRLLGGKVRDKLRVYQGLYTAPDVPKLLDQTAALEAAHGLTAFKLSPFRVDHHATRFGEVVRAAAEYFREVRERAPAHHAFAFDAHAKLESPWAARELGNALSPYDPLFFEEPLRPEHLPAWTELKQGLRCALATGESLYSAHQFLDLCAARGVDIAQPDICVVGGITETRRIAAVCEAHGVSLAPHNPMGPLATAVNLHFCLATTNAHLLEYRLPGGAYLDHTTRDGAGYVVDPYLPVGGYLHPRDERPGWGVTIDEDYLSSDRYIHWERRVPRRPDGSTAWP